MRKLIIVLSAILFLTSFSLAQENMGARPIGMGGAFTGVADDANAIFVNPAGIAYIKGENALISSKLSTDKGYTIMGAVENTSFGSIGLGYVSSSSLIENWTSSEEDDIGNSPALALNQALVISYGRELNDFMVVPEYMGRLSLGTNLKFSSLRLNNAKGLFHSQDSKVNLDLAAAFRLNDMLSLGLNVKDCLGNVPNEYAEGLESDPSMAVGLSGKLLNKKLTWSIDGKSLGCELRLVPALALRFGKDGQINTAGIGINVGNFSFDYAYMDKENPLHYVAISVAIDRDQKPAETKTASLNLY
jgi:hypothetical protein